MVRPKCDGIVNSDRASGRIGENPSSNLRGSFILELYPFLVEIGSEIVQNVFLYSNLREIRLSKMLIANSNVAAKNLKVAGEERRAVLLDCRLQGKPL